MKYIMCFAAGASFMQALARWSIANHAYVAERMTNARAETDVLICVAFIVGAILFSRVEINK